jgi:hypothetical protein
VPPLARSASIWPLRWEPGACLKVKLAREVFTFVGGFPNRQGLFTPCMMSSFCRSRVTCEHAPTKSWLAETMYDVDAEQTMRAVAACHEKLAQQVEQDSGKAGM